MAIAETAQLIVELSLKDQLSGGIKTATTHLSGLGGALQHAGGVLGNFASQIGLLGGAAGLLSFAGSIKESISKAEEFGVTVSKMAALTGLSVEKTSALASALDHFGISADTQIRLVGMLEKNLGNLALGAGTVTDKITPAEDELRKVTEQLAVANRKLTEDLNKRSVAESTLMADRNRIKDLTIKQTEAQTALNEAQADGADGVSNAEAFYKKYGLAIADASGNLKDANTLLLDSADYFNNQNIPATTKAAALAKLYGRNWQELLPFLQAGSEGIKDAEQAAKDFGLTLTADNVTALAKLRAATRDWGDALGGLELQIGLALVPALTDFTKAATGFVAGNRDKIVGFFKDFAKFAGDVGHVIVTDVVPVFNTIARAWNGLPPELRDLITKGLVAGKISKMLFDVGPLDILKAGALKLGLNIFGQRGTTPANPLFVSAVGGGLGGAGGAVGGAAGGLGKVAAGAAVVGSALAVVAVQQEISAQSSQQARDIHEILNASLDQHPDFADLSMKLAAVNTGIDQIRANPLLVLVRGSALDELEGMRADIQRQINLLADSSHMTAEQATELERINNSIQGQKLHVDVTLVNNTSLAFQYTAGYESASTFDRFSSRTRIIAV